MNDLLKQLKKHNPEWRKKSIINHYMQFFMRETQSMFKYSNLPETIPQTELEKILQVVGYAPFYEQDGELTMVFGTLGGENNRFYRPTQIIIANPRLPNRQLTIDKDCIVMKNDSYYWGLYRPLYKYCQQLAENDISMNLITINDRLINLISAPDDKRKKEAELYLKHIADGEQGVVLDEDLIDAIRTQPLISSTHNNILSQHIEYHQYLKASALNEIGLNANYNMKRESINSGESTLNEDVLAPLVEDMLNCRKNALKDINAKFSNIIENEIKVELNYPWNTHTEENNQHNNEGGNNGIEEI